MSEPAVLVSRQGAVAVLTLNRPDRLNAFTDRMGRELVAGYHDVADDRAVRTVVVTGAGAGFCAGADFEVLESAGAGDPDVGVPDYSILLARRIAKPVIAAVNGACAGVGLAIALSADLRFASTTAKITTAFARRGLVAEQGTAWLLRDLVGPSRSLDLLLSARVVTGAEALGMGLVDRALARADVLAEALRYAHELADYCSPASMAAMKAQVQAASASTLDEDVRLADELTEKSLVHHDFAQVGSRLAKGEKPQFLDPDRGWITPPA